MLYIYTTYAFPHATKNNICISFSGEIPEHTFKKCVSGSYQTMKYKICDTLGLRKCASGKRIKLLLNLAFKEVFHNLRLKPH